MNPLLVTAGIKALEKIDVKKIVMYVGIALCLIALYLYVRKKVKEYKADKIDESIMKQYEESIVGDALSYSLSEYTTMADSIYQNIHSPVLSINGGFLGVNQKGIYDTMKRLNNDSDYNQLVSAYGVREYKKPGRIYLKKPTDRLPGTLVAVLTRGEVKKINNILAENGLTSRIS